MIEWEQPGEAMQQQPPPPPQPKRSNPSWFFYGQGHEDMQDRTSSMV
jgi:hypothetical protein